MIFKLVAVLGVVGILGCEKGDHKRALASAQDSYGYCKPLYVDARTHAESLTVNMHRPFWNGATCAVYKYWVDSLSAVVEKEMN